MIRESFMLYLCFIQIITSSTCKWYEDLVNRCQVQIFNLQNSLPSLSESGSTDIGEEGVQPIIINKESLDKSRFQELSRQISRCSDVDFLNALKCELERQLEVQKKRYLQTSKVSVRVGRPQTFFKTEFHNNDDMPLTRYYHFDGESIAREMTLRENQFPSLLSAGKDDSKMCEFQLDMAKDMLGFEEWMTITETEFNSLWSEHGGFPYVRPSRLARRHLFSALSKKL